jgi:hypothetical protein
MKRIVAILFITALLRVAGAPTDDAQAPNTHGQAGEYVQKALSLKPYNAGFHYRLATAFGLATAGAGMFTTMSMGRKTMAEVCRLDLHEILVRFALLELFAVL